MKKLICLALILPALAMSANKTQNQIYVLCAASIGYTAMIEGRTGKGPKYTYLIQVGRIYTDLVDTQYRPAIAQVLAQMESGAIKRSDIFGTAQNCVRWYQDDEIGDIK